jgi:hypothetical protein
MSTEMLQELDLAQSAFGQNFLAEYIGNFLNRDTLISLVVHGSAVGQRFVSRIQVR